jgi:DNA polymerase III subunit beta
VKITINRELFLRVFQIAAAVAPARSPKPVLQNIKLDVLNDQVVITATDTEVGVRLFVPAMEVKATGSALIPVARMGLILRESRDESLNLETDNEKTVIKGQFSRFELQSQNPDEFPEVPGFTDTDYFQISSKAFRELIRRTLFATDAESSRYALGGVLLEFGEHAVTAVGTDGRRLAKMESPIDKIGKPDLGSGATIVPSRSMQLIERILPDSDDPVQLVTHSNEFLMKYQEGVFYTRLVEGRFPKWRDVIPRRTDSHQIDMTAGPLYSALRQAAIVANEESRGVDFEFGNGTLVLTNSTAEVGQSRIEMPVSFNDGELEISLDHRFVADFLKVLPPEQNFTFDLMDNEQAAYCYTNDNYGYVIMPMAKDRR